MKNIVLASSMAIITMAAGNAMGAACPSGYTETSVSGSVSTMNIGENNQGQQQQFGTIEMRLTKTNNSGKVAFDQHGTIFGTVTDETVDMYGRPVSILSHTITFEDDSSIETVGDEATITGAISQCSFVVEEVISNFWGTQTFKRATGEIRADGSISVPPCDNQNTFELSGTVCLFKGSK